MKRTASISSLTSTLCMAPYHLACLARWGCYMLLERRLKPGTTAETRYGIAYQSTKAVLVLPLMRRLFGHGAGLSSTGCCLNCVCALTSSNVGNTRPGFCNASTMRFFKHAHNARGFGRPFLYRDRSRGNNPVRNMIVTDLRPKPGMSGES